MEEQETATTAENDIHSLIRDGESNIEGVEAENTASNYCETVIEEICAGDSETNELESVGSPAGVGGQAGNDPDKSTADNLPTSENSFGYAPGLAPHLLLENSDLNQPLDKIVKKRDISTTFKVKLPAEIWDEIKPELNTKNVKEKRYQYQLKRNVWTHRFNDAFLKNVPADLPELKGCILRFKGHKINMKSGTFLNATATCSSQGGNCCKMKFNFKLRKQPKSEKEVSIRVTAEGDLIHDISLSRKRQLAGVARTEMKEKLMDMSASKLHHRIFSNSATDHDLITQGNDTQVQSAAVLKKARVEALATLDFDKDGFLDLIKRRKFYLNAEEFKTNVPGFIQELSETPFYLSMYTERQLNILKKLLKLNKNHCFFLDSTGTISTGLGEAHPNKRQFYYALTTLFPGNEDVATIPLLKVISGSHTACSIAAFLHYYFARYGEFSGCKLPGFGIKRMTTDFSKALISGVLQGLEIGTTLTYIKQAWECLAFSRKMNYVHHVCNWHIKNAMQDHIIANFKDRDESLQLVERFVNLLLKSSDLWDFCRRVDECIVLVGKPTRDRNMSKVISNLDRSTDKSGDLPFPLSSQTLTDQSEAVFYAQSPFGNFAIRRCYFHHIPYLKSFYKNVGLKGRLEVDNEDDGDPNPHYSKEFLKYLLEHIFPYQCLLDNSLITLNALPLTDLTNATAESWNSVLKERECKWELPDKVGRVVHKLKNCTEGRVIKFEHFLSRFELQKQVPTPITDQAEVDSFVSEENNAVNKRLKQKMLPNNDHNFPERSQERWGPKKQRAPKTAKDFMSIQDIKVVPQEGFITMGKNKFSLYSKCWADVSLQALHAIVKIDRESNCYFKTLEDMGVLNISDLLKVLLQVDLGNFEAVFDMLFKNILGYSFNITPGADFVDVMDSQDCFFSKIKYAFSFSQEYLCENSGCNVQKNSTVYPLVDSSIFISSESSNLRGMYTMEKKLEECEGTCGKDSQPVVKFKWGNLGIPPVFCINLPQQCNPIQEKDIPDSVPVLDTTFQTFIYTVHSRDHYYNVLLFKGGRYVFDGLYPEGHRNFSAAPEGHRISCLWLLRKAAKSHD